MSLSIINKMSSSKDFKYCNLLPSPLYIFYMELLSRALDIVDHCWPIHDSVTLESLYTPFLQLFNITICVYPLLND